MQGWDEIPNTSDVSVEPNDTFGGGPVVARKIACNRSDATTWRNDARGQFVVPLGSGVIVTRVVRLGLVSAWQTHAAPADKTIVRADEHYHKRKPSGFAVGSDAEGQLRAYDRGIKDPWLGDAYR